MDWWIDGLVGYASLHQSTDPSIYLSNAMMELKR